MTGGYKIIDLYGLDLANMQLDSTKIEKIFSDIESTYKTKALLFDNYKINGIEQNATFSSAIVKNSGFEITLGDYKILIKNDSVEDSTLHLYRHNIEIDITLNADSYYLYLTTYSSNKNTATNYIEVVNMIGNSKYVVGIDGGYANSNGYVINTIECDSSESITLYFFNGGNVINQTYNITSFDEMAISDAITKIF